MMLVITLTTAVLLAGLAIILGLATKRSSLRRLPKGVFTGTPLYALDIETCTNPGDGLDPTNPLTRIISVALYYGPERGADGPTGWAYFTHKNEAKLLAQLNKWLMAAQPGTIVTWNGASFDFAVILTRSKFCGVLTGLVAELHSDRKPKYGPTKGHTGGYIVRWGPHDHVDIWPLYIPIARAAGIKTGLKPVGRHYGFTPIEVSRTQMEKLTPEQLRAYNVSDVRVTYALALLCDNLRDRLDSVLFAQAH